MIVLRPKEPYRQWLLRTFPDIEEGDVPLAKLRTDDTIAYLVPMGEGEAVEARDFAKAHYGRFFAQQLSCRTQDTCLWPAERSLELFRRWFDIDAVDMVIDTVERL